MVSAESAWKKSSKKLASQPAGSVCSTKPSSGAHECLAEKNFLDKKLRTGTARMR
jgi:hypothetical protein